MAVLQHVLRSHNAYSLLYQLAYEILTMYDAPDYSIKLCVLLCNLEAAQWAWCVESEGGSGWQHCNWGRMHHQHEQLVVEGCWQWSDVAIILAPVGSGGADGGVNVVGQNKEGGWWTIKWHIIWLGMYKKTHLWLALLCKRGWFWKVNSGDASVDVHMHQETLTLLWLSLAVFGSLWLSLLMIGCTFGV